MTLAEGQVVRFLDRENKRRPAVILDVRDNGEVYLLEGTSQITWKDRGELVLLEVVGGTHLCVRMGLSDLHTTYFYAHKSRIVVLAPARVITGAKTYRCPDAHLRTMQAWMFQLFENEAPQVAKRTREAPDTQAQLSADE